MNVRQDAVERIKNPGDERITFRIAAERLGRGFDFDPVNLVAKDDEAADRYLYQSLREPWADEFMKG